jgi:hypothetical protein
MILETSFNDRIFIERQGIVNKIYKGLFKKVLLAFLPLFLLFFKTVKDPLVIVIIL